MTICDVYILVAVAACQSLCPERRGVVSSLPVALANPKIMHLSI